MSNRFETDRIERVFVTGGAGYVGSLLVPALIGKGYEVTVLDWFIFEPKLFLELDSTRLKTIKGDVRDKDIMRECLESSDYVIHLAGMSNDPSAVLNPQATEDINFKATVDLAKTAKELGVKRLIMASSASVYGIQDSPATEDSVCRPLTIYSQCKLRSEEEVLPLNDGNFTVTAVRPATLSGLAPRLRLDLVINNMASQAAATGRLKVYGGDQYRPNLSVKDMVSAYLTLLAKEESIIGGQTYNVSESNITIGEISERIYSVLGREHLEVQELPSDDKRSYWVESNKARREWGFNPAYGVIDSIQEIINAVLSGMIPDISLTKFRNVQILRDRDLMQIVTK